jgi:hypothetical protein
MTRQWYYGRGAEITGPVSDRELFALAEGGHILRTDTVWRDEVETGVPASRVKNLFPPDPIASVPDLEAPAAATHDSPEPAAVAEALPAIVPAPAKKTGRAVAGKGAVLVGQDGATVKYRGKCETCGREDASWKSIAIPRGTTRASFFCPKCRKRRDVEIHGYH